MSICHLEELRCCFRSVSCGSLNSQVCGAYTSEVLSQMSPLALMVLIWCSLTVHSILMKPKVSNVTRGHRKTTSTHQACRLGHILYPSVSSQVVGFSKVIWVSFTSTTCSIHFPCVKCCLHPPTSVSQIALGCLEGSCVSCRHPFFTGLWTVWPFSSIIVKSKFSKEETGPRHKGHLPSRHSHHKWIGKEHPLSPGEKTNIATIQRGSTTENLHGGR